MKTKSNGLGAVVATRLPVLTKRTLVKIANKNNLTKSELLRTIVENYLLINQISN
jgi:predicted DNA-binding protein